MLRDIVDMQVFVWTSTFAMAIALLAWQRIHSAAVSSIDESAVNSALGSAGEVGLAIGLAPLAAVLLDALPFWPNEWFSLGYGSAPDIRVWSGFLTFVGVALVPISQRHWYMSLYLVIGLTVVAVAGTTVLQNIVFPLLQFRPPPSYAGGIVLLICSLAIWARWGALRFWLEAQARAVQHKTLSSVGSLVRSGDSSTGEPRRQYDVFVSHASEDKQQVVLPLVRALKSHGLAVWYDDDVLRPGESLRERIDHGIAASRMGVVVVSKDYMRKGWTELELNALITRAATGEQLLLPIVHDIALRNLIAFSPLLAGKVVRDTAKHSVEEISSEISELLGAPMAAHVPSPAPEAPSHEQ
jgi:hypothetical protein